MSTVYSNFDDNTLSTVKDEFLIQCVEDNS